MSIIHWVQSGPDYVERLINGDCAAEDRQFRPLRNDRGIVAIERQAVTWCWHVAQNIAIIPATAASLEQSPEVFGDRGTVWAGRHLEDA